MGDTPISVGNPAGRDLKVLVEYVHASVHVSQ